MGELDFLSMNPNLNYSNSISSIAPSAGTYTNNTGLSGLGSASAGTAGSGFGLSDLGGLEGIGSLLAGLGSIYSSIVGGNVAKDTLKFQKNAFNTNIRNQTQAYNTNLEDRVRARYSFEGRPSSAADEYISKNKL